jgi:pyruvate dehydrogenase E2 component (dihydrolipoamide acetyltransferase)
MTDLLMPKLGLTMTEGMLSQWRVAPGDRVARGNVIFTVETEKVANEIEAETDLTIAEILVAEGETVPVGTPVARLADAGAAAPPPGTGSNARGTKEDGLRIVATPLARRLARAAGVDLAAVTGSGPHGRIKAGDVEKAAPAATPAAGVIEIIPDPTRLAVARRVTAAKRDIPHFYVTHEAEISAAMALRDDLNAKKGCSRVSVTHMLVRALGLALSEMPAANRIWSGDRIVAFATADIGMLTETPEGLRMPMIRDAGRRRLREIAADATALAERARTGRLTPADVGGGAAAISNVGMFGVTSLTPIISPPQAMMLGVGGERGVFRPDAAGAPALRREITLTLACDHRVIDGAEAARFLAALVAILKHPARLLHPAPEPQENPHGLFPD